MSCDRDDLRHMRDRQDLARVCNRPEFLRDLFGDMSGDAGIDLIENHRRQILAADENGLECQHDPTHLAAGCRLGKRLNRFADVGRNHELDLIDAI